MAHTSSASSSLPVRLAATGAHSTGTTGLTLPIFASWDQAITLFKTQLTEDDEKIRRLETFPKGDFSDFRAAAVAARDKTESKRLKSTPTIQKVMEQINRYAAAGDLAMQQSEYTSLAWGAFRFLIQAAAEEGKMSAKISDGLEDVLQVMFRTQRYAQLFSSYDSLSAIDVFQSLQNNITELYAQVLNFLVRTVFFFEKNTLKRHVYSAFSPFDTTFKEILDRIEKLERNIDKDIQQLEREATIRKDNDSWLQAADYSADIIKLNEQHIDGTCQWFLKRDDYVQWRDATVAGSNMLWVQGKPGCGKSTVAARIVQDIERHSSKRPVGIFCKTKEDRKNDFASVLGGIISQIIFNSSTPPRLHSLVQSFRSSSNAMQPPLSTLWSLLRQALSQVDEITCVLDGLDECNESTQDRTAFLKNLSELFALKQTGQNKHKIISLSRLDSSEVSTYGSWTCVSIEIEDLQEDIKSFVSASLDNSSKLTKHPQRESIYRYLIENSSGMILWAKLMLNELDIGHKRVDRVLGSIPKGLFEVYATIFRRFSKSETTAEYLQIQSLLSLVFIAVRPLTLEELSIALVMYGQTSSDVNPPEAYTIEETKSIINLAAPLLITMPDQTVQVTHASLVQYVFDSRPAKIFNNTSSVDFSFNKSTMHMQMALLLCVYLQSPIFEDLWSPKPQVGDFTELHAYACQNLIHHSVQAISSENISKTLDQFFESKFGWRWLWHLQKSYPTPLPNLQIMQSQYRGYIKTFKARDNNHQLYHLLTYLSNKEYQEKQLFCGNEDSKFSCLQRLAKFYMSDGQYTKAEPLQFQAMETLKRMLGVENIDTLVSMGNLASTYWDLCRWSEAEILNKQVLEIEKRVLGDDHPSTLVSMANLSSMYFDQGRLSEAEALGVQVLQASKRVLGDEDPGTLVSMANLAAIYSAQCRWTDAENLEKPVLDIKKRVLGDKHPDTLISMSQLAATYHRQERWGEAEALRFEILEMSKDLLGEEHPETLNRMKRLSGTYWKQGRWDEAETLLRQALEISKRVVGEEHPDTLNKMAELANMCWLQNRMDEAEALESQALETSKRVLGDEHHETLVKMVERAKTFAHQGRWDKAEPLELHVLETRKRVLGDEHPSTREARLALAWTYRQLGREKEAEELEIQAGTQGDDKTP